MTPQEEIARLKILLATARCFGRAMDLSTLIGEILNRAEEVMGAEVCSLLLPEPHTDDLIIHSTDSRVAALPQALKVPAGQGLAGAVLKSKKSLNIQDAQNDPRHYQGLAKKIGFATRAILTIPLLEGAHCLGVLQAINPIGRVHFDEQDEEIFEGFGGLIVGALLRLETQKREIERVQSDQELSLAREIQDSFLPSGVQKFPYGQVHLHYSPAKKVGGDFYFVHPLDGRRLLLGLGDVSGKGVPAALTMARASATIQATKDQMKDDLGEWVTLLNRKLMPDLRAGRFIGLTFLLVNPDSASLQICAAGQFAPFHFDGQSWKHWNVQNHLPLGISESSEYRSARAPLNPGDFWMLFSDGIPEARNNTGDEFTVPEFLKKIPTGSTGKKSIDSAVGAWRNFVGAAPQHDDASLLLLDWRGTPPSSELATICSPETLSVGRAFVEQWAAFAGYDDVLRGQIVLACDEAVSNIFRHAYEKHPGPLKLMADVSNDTFTIQILDEARPVDVTKIKGRSLSELKPGGLGTFIMSQIFDEVNYEPQPRGTKLTLKKSLP
ncbi:MAG: SpoIIE family protein phosphatase [Verrucomicrobiota bacterium]